MMKRSAVFLIVCLCVLMALPSAFAGEAKKAPETKAAPTKAAAPAMKYKEAPVLAALVKAGKLPAVEKRLPENPLVVPGDEIGQYGGVWRRGFLGPSDFNGVNRVIYDVLARFGPDGATIEMKLAESVTPSADFKTWTVKLRKGMKWSDGSPFTTDDIMYWYKDVLQNKDLVPAIPSWMLNKDGSLVLVERADALNVRWVFKEPNTNFLLELTTKDYGDRLYPIFQPSKYLKQFHASYAKKEALDKMAADAKFKTWTELYASKQSPFENPQRPGMAAWIASNRISDQIFILKRNPYYIGVDSAGNQLPYIDEVRFTFFADTQALNLAAIAGELDQQDRHINMTNYPVLKENEQAGKYKITTWPDFGGADAVIMFNQTYNKDPQLAKLLQNRDFRIALSYAIDRKSIQESAFLGLGEPRQGVAAPWHPYYPGDDVAHKYTEFKPDEANKMLDGLGLNKKDANGIPLASSVTAANVNDITQLAPLLNQIPPVAGKVGHPRKKPDAVQGDLAYDSEPHRQGLRQMGVEPVLPEKGIDDQSGLGETRWPVERTLAWAHQNRRLRIRYERRPDIHQALLTLACIKICARALFAGFC